MSTATISAPVITQKHKDDYRTKGFFILERVIPQEHLQILRDTVAYYLEQIHAEMDRAGKDVMGLCHRNNRYFISNKWAERPDMAKFLFSDYMADICRATLGPETYLFHEQYVLKAAEKGMKFAWHQDSGYVGFKHRTYLSCWCALDDMSEANGTVYMLPYDRAGSNEQIEHKQDAKTNDLVGYFGDDPGDPVICPAGSIAVFSSVCFHRSGTNSTDKMRRVYLAQYSAEPIIKPDGTIRALAEPFLKGGRNVHR